MWDARFNAQLSKSVYKDVSLMNNTYYTSIVTIQTCHWYQQQCIQPMHANIHLIIILNHILWVSQKHKYIW